MRAVAREFRVSLATVQRWVRRAHGRRLDRVDWTDRPPIPRRVQRTPRAVEEQVLAVRRHLREESVLGEYGAPAIHRELRARGERQAPSIRTIGRILERRGALERPRRVRRPAPPPGWYLPPVEARQVELESFDTIEGLKIQDGPLVEVLTGISLHGGLPGAWPSEGVTARFAAHTLVAHWQEVGLPGYAQFDNATVFQGAHQHRDSISRVMRICLSLGVVPVFAPPREHGFQAAIESLNGRWQSKVWSRFHHADLADLTAHSARYVHAVRRRRAARLAGAPQRRPFPRGWVPELQRRPQGTIVFLRRTSEAGQVFLLGRWIGVKPDWPHRLVRAEVDLDAAEIRFYALRRRAPSDQPLLATVAYHLPSRPFQG
jgi:putative transposase